MVRVRYDERRDVVTLVLGEDVGKKAARKYDVLPGGNYEGDVGAGVHVRLLFGKDDRIETMEFYEASKVLPDSFMRTRKVTVYYDREGDGVSIFLGENLGYWGSSKIGYGLDPKLFPIPMTLDFDSENRIYRIASVDAASIFPRKLLDSAPPYERDLPPELFRDEPDISGGRAGKMARRKLGRSPRGR